MLRSLPTRALKVEKINRKKRALRNNNTEQRGIYMPLNNIQSNYNFIDLFAGAGGLSEGFLQAGFNPVAHVEMNEFAAKTLETRSAYYYLKSTNNLGLYKKYLSGKITRDEFVKQIPASITKTVINETMSDDTLPAVFKTIDGIMKIRGISKVDVIVGGPPCQAYSLVGRAQSSHMEVPMAEDPRNYLYKLYARFLKRYQPRMFVFENVIGIESANGGTTWKNIQKYLKRVGYEIECHEQNAQTFGVLQNRRRIIIVGWLKKSGLKYPDFLKIKSDAVVNDLFTDLPKLHPGESSDKYARTKTSRYVLESGIRTADDILTLHICRPNKERDIEIYRRAVELWNDGHKRLNYNDLPEELKTHKNRHSFTDRFKVVEGDEKCCHKQGNTAEHYKG
jgi:DNA (cytosine-5)-methyltransferase 1